MLRGNTSLLSFLVLLAGLIIKLTGDRLKEENNQIYYVCTDRGFIGILGI